MFDCKTMGTENERQATTEVDIESNVNGAKHKSLENGRPPSSTSSRSSLSTSQRSLSHSTESQSFLRSNADESPSSQSELNATTEQPNEISEILLKIADKHWWDALFKVLKHIEKSPTASLTEKDALPLTTEWEDQFHRTCNEAGGNWDVNQYYLDRVTNGNVKDVMNLFEYKTRYRTDVRVVRLDKESNNKPFSVAIKNRDKEMFRFLISDEEVSMKKADFSENFFLSIEKNFVDGVRLMLDTDLSLSKKIKNNAELSPIAFAAIKDNYQIIDLLHKRKHQLEKDAQTISSLKSASRKRSLSKAKASKAFISVVKKDGPIAYCSELYQEFTNLAESEHELYSFYTELAYQVEEYACSLLDKVETDEELAELFGYSLPDDKGSLKIRGFKFLPTYRSDNCDMNLLEQASKVGMKKFLKHEKSQLALAAVRYGNNTALRQKSILTKFCVNTLIGLLYPLWSLLYILFPSRDFGKCITHPNFSLAGHLASDFVFIILLITNTLRKSPQTDYLGAPPTALEWSLVVWIVGKLGREGYELRTRGCKNYFGDWWNYLDISQLLLFSTVIALRITDYIEHYQSEEKLTRGTWSPYEARTLATGILALAYVFVFLQVLSLMRTSKTFGPLLLSLSNMLVNALQFLCIFIFVILGFALALTEVYSYYGTHDGYEILCQSVKNGTNAQCIPTKFHGVQHSLSDLFWSLFGFIDVHDVSLRGRQPFLENIGYILIGAYLVSAIIILLNMLIAMMAKSFDAINENKLIEWKYYRTLLWLRFIRQEMTLPPPMNIIPNFGKILTCKNKSAVKVTLPAVGDGNQPDDATDDPLSPKTSHDPSSPKTTQPEDSSSSITSILVQRYVETEYQPN